MVHLKKKWAPLKAQKKEFFEYVQKQTLRKFETTKITRNKFWNQIDKKIQKKLQSPKTKQNNWNPKLVGDFVRNFGHANNIKTNCPYGKDIDPTFVSMKKFF